MENSIFKIKNKGQALFEFYLVLAILIPLCVVGFYRIGLLGEKKMETEKQRFNNGQKKISYADMVTPLFSLNGNEEPFSLMNDQDEDYKTVSFKSQGKIIRLIESGDQVKEIISYYRKQFQEQNWVEEVQHGIWIFSKENRRAFLWTTDQEVALIFY